MDSDYLKSQKLAHHQVKRALEDGSLTRPSSCCLCAYIPASDYIVAHHWQGYDKPLDVLWICRSCNRILAYKHDGSLTLEQAKKYVKSKKRKRTTKAKGELKSRVKELAIANGYNRPSELIFDVRMPNHQIKSLWGQGYFDKVMLKTAARFAKVFNCEIADLYDPID